MPSIDTYRKLAKQLVRWHEHRNHSVGGRVRLLDRFRDLTDSEILAMPLPLTVAQEIVANEAGVRDWAALKAAAGAATPSRQGVVEPPVPAAAVPIFFVRDVAAAAAYYERTFGFTTDFLHGKPAFYGAVSRGALRLHLRHVGEPNFAALARQEGSLILATVETVGVKALFAEFAARGADFAQRLTRQPWGGIDFHVRDLDGNVFSFVEYRAAAGADGQEGPG